MVRFEAFQGIDFHKAVFLEKNFILVLALHLFRSDYWHTVVQQRPFESPSSQLDPLWISGLSLVACCQKIKDGDDFPPQLAI